MRYSDLEAFVTAGFEELGYNQSDSSFPVLNPGPPTSVDLLKLSTQRIIFLQLGSGSSMTTEQLFDRPFITARVIGNQDDYYDAENLAYELDRMFLQVCSNTVVGTAHTLYIMRSGGAPQLLEKDSADRYHFQCAYITETESGL